MHESKQAQYSTVGGAEQLIRQAIGAKQWSYSTGTTKDTKGVFGSLGASKIYVTSNI